MSRLFSKAFYIASQLNFFSVFTSDVHGYARICSSLFHWTSLHPNVTWRWLTRCPTWSNLQRNSHGQASTELPTPSRLGCGVLPTGPSPMWVIPKEYLRSLTSGSIYHERYRTKVDLFFFRWSSDRSDRLRTWPTKNDDLDCDERFKQSLRFWLYPSISFGKSRKEDWKPASYSPVSKLITYVWASDQVWLNYKKATTIFLLSSHLTILWRFWVGHVSAVQSTSGWG